MTLDIGDDINHLHRRSDNPFSFIDQLGGSCTLFAFQEFPVVSHDDVQSTNEVNLVNSIFNANLIEALYDLLLKVYGVAHIVYILIITHCFVESLNFDEKQSQIRQLIHLPFIVFNGIQNVERNQLTD